MKIVLCRVTLCFLILVYPMKVFAMSLSDTEIVLFSPLSGTITYKGKPVANVEIIRLVKWKDSIGESDIFTTNGRGEFSLPIKTATVRVGALTEFVMSQNIRVRYNGEEIQIWGKSKRSTNLYGELGGAPKNFRCELTDEIEYFDVADGLFGTSCKWDSM